MYHKSTFTGENGCDKFIMCSSDGPESIESYRQEQHSRENRKYKSGRLSVQKWYSRSILFWKTV